MPKKDFLIRKLEGQIDGWDAVIYRLNCEAKDT